MAGMNVGELKHELATLASDEPAPADLLLAALEGRVDWSYIQSALSEWSEIAAVFGRENNFEVDQFLCLLSEVL
jgi:hypothetical protein